jgi:hypothetical protein
MISQLPPRSCCLHRRVQRGRLIDQQEPRRLLSLGVAISLAPTKLTDLAFELDQARQRGVQSEVDRIRRELVLETLKPQNVESGEDRPDKRLLAVGPRVCPNAGSERV